MNSFGLLRSRVVCSLALLFAFDAITAEPSPLTLDAALARAQRESPLLEGFAWELRAADGRVVQAGLRPNPELSIEVEEIPLGPRGGASLSDAELTIGLAQQIELGRKRAHRTSKAREERATPLGL